MQGCQLKQIKPSPALHAAHTWWAHAHRATPHTDAGRRTKRPLTSFHHLGGGAGWVGGGGICFQRSAARPAVVESGGERRDGSEKKNKKGSQGIACRGKKLVISLSCKVVAAPVWAELQVRALVVRRRLKDSDSKRVGFCIKGDGGQLLSSPFCVHLIPLEQLNGIKNLNMSTKNRDAAVVTSGMSSPPSPVIISALLYYLQIKRPAFQIRRSSWVAKRFLGLLLSISGESIVHALHWESE